MGLEVAVVAYFAVLRPHLPDESKRRKDNI